MISSTTESLILEYSTSLRAHRQPNWMTYGFIKKLEQAKKIQKELSIRHDKQVDIRVWRYSTALGSRQVI